MYGHEEGGGEGQGEGERQGEGGQEGETTAAVSSSSEGAVTAPAAAAPPMVGDTGAGAGAGAVIDANAAAVTPRTADTAATTPRSTRSLPRSTQTLAPLITLTHFITPSDKHYHSLLHTVSLHLHILLHHLTCMLLLTPPCRRDIAAIFGAHASRSRGMGLMFEVCSKLFYPHPHSHTVNPTPVTRYGTNVRGTLSASNLPLTCRK